MSSIMAQTAAHLVDHVIPPVPVRQWVISVPKRLRCFLADRPEAVAALTKIFLAEIERLLSASGCGAFRETRSGRPGRSSRGSQVAHRPEDRCGRAIDRAILTPFHTDDGFISFGHFACYRAPDRWLAGSSGMSARTAGIHVDHSVPNRSRCFSSGTFPIAPPDSPGLAASGSDSIDACSG